MDHWLWAGLLASEGERGTREERKRVSRGWVQGFGESERDRKGEGVMDG